MTTRRRIISAISAIGAAQLFAPAIFTSQARASQNVLRILRWKNFVPAYETWINDQFVRNWGRENDTEVIVTNVGLGEIGRRAAAEIAAGEGHDLVLFLSPRPSLEDHTIDHRDLLAECESRFGSAYHFASQSSINPRTGKYHGFIESYAPTVVTYRKDIWDAVGTAPETWDDIRKAGRAAKLLHEAPIGISLAPEHNSNHSLRALMAAFGSSVQDRIADRLWHRRIRSKP